MTKKELFLTKANVDPMNDDENGVVYISEIELSKGKKDLMLHKYKQKKTTEKGGLVVGEIQIEGFKYPINIRENISPRTGQKYRSARDKYNGLTMFLNPKADTPYNSYKIQYEEVAVERTGNTNATDF